MLGFAKIVVFVTAAALLLPSYADQPTVPRIGVLGTVSTYDPYEQGLHDGLRELGYLEGRNIMIEWRRPVRANDELQPLAAQLSRLKLDVIVALNTPAARAASKSGSTPVVFLSSDPVAAGLASTLARPGGNATGVSVMGPQLTAKRMEVLRLLESSRRIGCLVNSSNPVGPLQFEEARAAARALGVDLVKLDAKNDGEVDAALRAIPGKTLDAILITGDTLFLANKTKISDAIRKAKLPAMVPAKDFLGDGALMSYGPNLKAVGRKLAGYVDKILKGAKSGDLPIEQVSSYELVIDLRAAQELGIKVPQEILLRADEVIR
jgi:putative ABC transport system substrate-binding protein